MDLQELYNEMTKGMDLFTEIKLTRACNDYGNDVVLLGLELISVLEEYNEVFNFND